MSKISSSRTHDQISANSRLGQQIGGAFYSGQDDRDGNRKQHDGQHHFARTGVGGDGGKQRAHGGEADGAQQQDEQQQRQVAADVQVKKHDHDGQGDHFHQADKDEVAQQFGGKDDAAVHRTEQQALHVAVFHFRAKLRLRPRLLAKANATQRMPGADAFISSDPGSNTKLNITTTVRAKMSMEVMISLLRSSSNRSFIENAFNMDQVLHICDPFIVPPKDGSRLQA